MASEPTQLGETFFTSILEENKQALREKLRETLLAGVARQFEWELPEAVKKAVAEFVADEIIPEIRAELTASRDEFVNAATAMVRGIPAEIGKAMQERLAGNLTNSWTVRKIAEECFK